MICSRTFLSASLKSEVSGAVGSVGRAHNLRSDFFYTQSGSEGDGVVTYEEAFTVQPFNNIVATQTFTGAQLLDVLKDQWCGTNTSQTVLLPSSSIHYSFSFDEPTV